MARPAHGPEPRYVGGQAVIEGVMIRGLTTWAVSVRLPDGSIRTEVHDAPRWAERWVKVPLVRGVVTLAESLTLGMRALTWAAEQAIQAEEAEERRQQREAAGLTEAAGGPVGTAAPAADDDAHADEQPALSKWAMRLSMALGIVLFVGLFMVLPGVLSKLLTDGSTSFNIVDGLIKLGMFMAYLIGIGFVPDIRRVFQYHGAEHKAIAAYENDLELTPRTAQQFTTEHVRCGTSFLLVVMVISIASHLLFGRPGFGVLLLSRILLVLPIAAVSYEIIRVLARNQRFLVVRLLSKPGRLLQRLTTREPSDEQVEVAITALKAVLPAEELAAVEARTATRPQHRWGVRRDVLVPDPA